MARKYGSIALQRHVAAVRIDEQTWLGWAAGIIDGEGCIYLAAPGRGKRRQWGLYVIVGNTDMAMLEKLRELFGGRIKPLKRRGPKWKPCWHWLVSGRAALTVLGRIRPWLVTKAERADLGLEAAGLSWVRDGEAFAVLRERLKEMNRRGAEVADAV